MMHVYSCNWNACMSQHKIVYTDSKKNSTMCVLEVQ